MKHYILKEVAKYLNNFKLIKLIKRSDNNELFVEFDSKNYLFFDLTRGNASIYKKETNEHITRDFAAPFDVMLQKRLSKASIQSVYLYQNDKILNIEVSSKSSYKSTRTTLQLEFTGKHTNAIILDESGVVLDALRHIDDEMSSRVVKVGQKLGDIPKPTYTPQEGTLSDVSEYLEQVYRQKQSQQLQKLKDQKNALLNKANKSIQKKLDSLPSSQELELQSKQMYEKANLLLGVLHTIKPYQKNVEVYNAKGERVSIELDIHTQSPQQYINRLFASAKKLKQKARYQYLEKESLSQKLAFNQKLMELIQRLHSTHDIEFYMPKKQKNQSKTQKSEHYASFFYNGYKIMLGRNEKENIYLLEHSKASDFWFHLKDIHSAHVIVANRKKSLPEDVVEKAAKICAEFSTHTPGKYTVDYTQRRNVKIQSKANVLYNPYSTIQITL